MVLPRKMGMFISRKVEVARPWEVNIFRSLTVGMCMSQKVYMLRSLEVNMLYVGLER